jgi:hypothetical protein
MKRTFALPLTAFALLAASCTSSGTTTSSEPATSDPGTTEPVTTDPGTTDPGTTDPGDDGSAGPVGFAPASLQQFDDCSAFVDYVHTEGAERVGPYGLDGGGFFGFPEVFATDDVAEESADAPAATEAASEDRASGQFEGGDGSFSTTNVQVEGVDEPDIVKTDGDRILAITGETLHYIDVSEDGTTGTKRGSVVLSSETQYAYGYEIFITGDRAVVFAQGEGFNQFGRGEPIILDDVAVAEPAFVEPADAVDEGEADAEAGFAPTEPAPEPAPVEAPIPVEPDAPIGRPIAPGEYSGPQTVIIEIDMSDPDDLTVANTMRIDGRYISARSIGDTARVVVTSPPQDLGFLYPSNEGTEDKAEEANRQVILDSTAEDWIPGYTVTSADGTAASGQLVDCSDIHAPADFGGFDMLSIVTLDLGSSLDAPTGTSSVMATGDTVYASADRMYITTNIWEPIINEQTNEWLDENYQTAVHRFSIAGDGPANYEASGSVDGHLLNQFSMNDRDGVFYVATTTGAPWSGEGSESQIVAMEIDGDQLVEIGKVGGLGKGERIFSVRYVDDTAYVVTFRQIDPFYVLDLSDPRNMSVQGELKIPGFSSYLHPMSDTLVLGVGQDATDEGRTSGTKVSLFDVSDPANPLEVDVWTMPNGFSDAEFDHRAFLWWAPTNTAVLPLQSYSDRFAGAVVLKIENNTITEQGRIQHSDEETGVVGQTDCRVLTADDIGSNENNELFWVADSGGQVQACGPNEQGGAVGLFCSQIPLDELELYYWEGEPTIDTTGLDRIEICYPDWNGFETAVQRTMVIDGNLWTLSPTRVQSNDLGTLDRTAAIDLT